MSRELLGYGENMQNLLNRAQKNPEHLILNMLYLDMWGL